MGGIRYEPSGITISEMKSKLIYVSATIDEIMRNEKNQESLKSAIRLLQEEKNESAERALAVFACLTEGAQMLKFKVGMSTLLEETFGGRK